MSPFIDRELEAEERAHEVNVRVRAAATTLLDARNAYDGAVVDVRTQALRDTLGEIRPMAEVGSLNLLTPPVGVGTEANQQAVANLHDATAYYPAEWVARAADLPPEVTDLPENKGYFRIGEIGTPGLGDDRSQSTAVHELGHFMEEAGGSSITASEWAFYQMRTGNETEPLQDLKQVTGIDEYGSQERTGGRVEQTRVDDFASPYMGKSYGGTPTSNYELLTMGMEHLRNPSRNSPKTDDHYLAWLFGTLAVA